MNVKCRELNDNYEKDHNQELDNGVAIKEDDAEKETKDDKENKKLWKEQDKKLKEQEDQKIVDEVHTEFKERFKIRKKIVYDL